MLSVVEDGILRGYVPFDKDWTGFSAEEYREASESVMKEPDVTVTADVKKRLDLTGYEIVRVQYFSTMQNPAMTISNGRLRFNTACLKKFENVEYVELLLNSVERCIAIRPCDKNNPKRDVGVQALWAVVDLQRLYLTLWNGMRICVIGSVASFWSRAITK